LRIEEMLMLKQGRGWRSNVKSGLSQSFLVTRQNLIKFDPTDFHMVVQLVLGEGHELGVGSTAAGEE
jgi:hypothetical protein